MGDKCQDRGGSGRGAGHRGGEQEGRLGGNGRGEEDRTGLEVTPAGGPAGGQSIQAADTGQCFHQQTVVTGRASL